MNKNKTFWHQNLHGIRAEMIQFGFGLNNNSQGGLHPSAHNTIVPPVSNAILQAPHDAGSSQITIHHLNGHNYLQWASGVRLFVARKGKLGYLDGTTARPPVTDPRYSM